MCLVQTVALLKLEGRQLHAVTSNAEARGCWQIHGSCRMCACKPSMNLFRTHVSTWHVHSQASFTSGAVLPFVSNTVAVLNAKGKPVIAAFLGRAGICA